MKYLLVVVILVGLIFGGGYYVVKNSFSSSPKPTPTDEPARQLPPEKEPKVSLEFTPDSHYVTVKLTNVHANKVDYSLIYDAKIKRKGQTQELNTGVTGGGYTNKDSKTYTSTKQLLGSESSGKITHHEDIKNAILELTLRDDKGRSVFKTTYPFTLSPGKTVELAKS